MATLKSRVYYQRGYHRLDWNAKAKPEPCSLGVHNRKPRYRLSGAQSTERIPTSETERIFRENVEKWREDTKYFSSITDIVLPLPYQRIIGLGPEALPLILRELSETRGHWFWALRAITGVDPVPGEDHGRVRAMAAHWLGWAKEQGYTW
jgi:hypothetical protein